MGVYNNLLQVLRCEEENIFKNYLRMTGENFDELLSFIRADITKENTNMRGAIPPEVKFSNYYTFSANSHAAFKCGILIG